MADIDRNDAVKAYRALGLLMQQIPEETPIAEWSVRGGSIDVLHGHFGMSDDDIRRNMRHLAKLLDFTHDEQPAKDGKRRIALYGTVANVNVDISVLVKPCACACHSEGEA